MDPSNTTPAEPNGAVSGTASGTTDSPTTPVSPTTEPAPVTPTVPATPTSPTVAPVNADVANAALNPPVNPVVTPTSPQTNGASATTAASGTMSMNQMFQTQPVTKADVFAETTAIAVPEGPKAPDPVEEELKAPLKAAGPVPGSIGSAVSVPAESGTTSNAAAAVNPADNLMTATPTNPTTPATPAGKKPSFFDKLTAKSKMDKKTLIILFAVAGAVLVALIILLILVATGAI